MSGSACQQRRFLFSSGGRNPEAAAELVRSQWLMGTRPIRSMVHLLEAHGVRVFSLQEEGPEVDAFSLWRGDVPYVFLNGMKSAEHSRFDAAHELGHLVLHRHGDVDSREVEREADHFASAFLMPRASVVAAAPRVPTIPVLIQLKQLWNVSLSALNYRLHAVGAVSDWQYRNLCIEIAKRGYRTREPQGSARETSQVLAKVFSALRAEGVTRAEVADALALPRDEVDKLVFGLVLTSVEGGSRGQADSPRPLASLRLV